VPTKASMSLYALGDLHLSYPFNREALDALKPHPEDGLILCGDALWHLSHIHRAKIESKAETYRLRDIFQQQSS